MIELNGKVVPSRQPGAEIVTREAHNIQRGDRIAMTFLDGARRFFDVNDVRDNDDDPGQTLDVTEV